MGPTGVDSLTMSRTGGSSTPDDEITPNIPSVIPKHSMSSTDAKSQPESSMKNNTKMINQLRNEHYCYRYRIYHTRFCRMI